MTVKALRYLESCDITEKGQTNLFWGEPIRFQLCMILEWVLEGWVKCYMANRGASRGWAGQESCPIGKEQPT